jgi:Flp pilus assembly pilin Flp
MNTLSRAVSSAFGAVAPDRSRRGQGLVEYSLVVLFIAIACVAALAAFGRGVDGLWQIAVDSMPW